MHQVVKISINLEGVLWEQIWTEDSEDNQYEAENFPFCRCGDAGFVFSRQL
jgi:hypothetical protein